MKYSVRCRENGDVIEYARTMEKAEAIIAKYEAEALNEADFEEGARKLYDWLRDNGNITESDNNALAHLMGDPVAEVDNLIDSLTL